MELMDSQRPSRREEGAHFTARVYVAGSADNGNDPERIPSYLRHRYRIESAVAVMALPAIAPLLAILGLWVRVVDGHPSVFRQVRVSPDGTNFEILKFRTYRTTHNPNAVAIRSDGTLPSTIDATDLLPGARMIRLLGLDELPQIINIIRGQMSFIGPRPLPTHLRDAQAQRVPIRLGVLGLAQSATRRKLELTERIALDNCYAATASLRLDLTILRRTVSTILRGDE